MLHCVIASFAAVLRAAPIHDTTSQPDEKAVCEPNPAPPVPSHADGRVPPPAGEIPDRQSHAGPSEDPSRRVAVHQCLPGHRAGADPALARTPEGRDGPAHPAAPHPGRTIRTTPHHPVALHITRRRLPGRRLKNRRPTPPDWFHNLRAHPDDVAIEIDGARIPVRPRVVVEPERDDLWRRVNDNYNGYATYQDRAGDRIIPIVLLER
jgi:hypothetical protein